MRHGELGIDVHGAAQLDFRFLVSSFGEEQT